MSKQKIVETMNWKAKGIKLQLLNDDGVVLDKIQFVFNGASTEYVTQVYNRIVTIANKYRKTLAPVLPSEIGVTY